MPASPGSSADFIDALYRRVPTARLTLALVAINVLVFLALAVDAGALWRVPGSLLADWGGNYAVQTRDGQVWRLLTGLFLHGGLLHVGLNMLALYQAGQLAERLFGPRRFLVVYLACGVVAGLASMWWRPNGLSIGASGAIFGIFGALLSHVVVSRRHLPEDLFRRMRRLLAGVVFYSLVIGFLIPGIDNAAHVGGLAAGLVLGAALAVPLEVPAGATWRALAGWALVTAASAALWQATPAPHHRAPIDPALAQLNARVAADEEDLVGRYETLVDGLRQGRIGEAETIDQIEQDLIPGWRRLEQQVAAAGHGDWRVVLLHNYLAKRRDALQVLVMAIRSHEPRALELANALQAQADQFLIEYNMALSSGRRPPPVGPSR